MIDNIEEEISMQNRGAVGHIFNMWGRDSWFSRPKKILGKLYNPDNCYTWDREKLEIAGIVLQSDRDIIISSPKAKIDLTKLASKAAVYVAVIGIFDHPIAVTEWLHNKIGKRAWRALSSLRNDTCNIDGKTFDNVVAKTTAYIDETELNTTVNVEKVVILVKIKNGICCVDITEDIKSYIYECIKPEFDTDEGAHYDSGSSWDYDYDI